MQLVLDWGMQAMQQWGGQQWQGSMTAMGVPQGWMGPYPMRMAPAGAPLQSGPMPSRQHLQGTVVLAAIPSAYIGNHSAYIGNNVLCQTNLL